MWNLLFGVSFVVMLKELNPIIHSQLRLVIMTLLVSAEEVDFNYLKEQINAWGKEHARPVVHSVWAKIYSCNTYSYKF